MNSLKLTKKERRLADLLAKTDGDQLNIGYACKELHTTPRTLLGKTLPGLRKKLEASATNEQIAEAQLLAWQNEQPKDENGFMTAADGTRIKYEPGGKVTVLPVQPADYISTTLRLD